MGSLSILLLPLFPKHSPLPWQTQGAASSDITPMLWLVVICMEPAHLQVAGVFKHVDLGVVQGAAGGDIYRHISSGVEGVHHVRGTPLQSAGRLFFQGNQRLMWRTSNALCLLAATTPVPSQDPCQTTEPKTINLRSLHSTEKPGAADYASLSFFPFSHIQWGRQAG